MALSGQLARVGENDFRLPVVIADLPCHADALAQERGLMKVSNRRVSLIPVRPDEGPLTGPTPVARPGARELVFMPPYLPFGNVRRDRLSWVDCRPPPNTVAGPSSNKRLLHTVVRSCARRRHNSSA